jgi:hypothetical protein
MLPLRDFEGQTVILPDQLPALPGCCACQSILASLEAVWAGLVETRALCPFIWPNTPRAGKCMSHCRVNCLPVPAPSDG